MAAIARKQADPAYYVNDGYFLHYYTCAKCGRYHIGNTRTWEPYAPKKEEEPTRG